jgi:hypothetical protein
MLSLDPLLTPQRIFRGHAPDEGLKPLEKWVATALYSAM